MEGTDSLSNHGIAAVAGGGTVGRCGDVGSSIDVDTILRAKPCYGHSSTESLRGGNYVDDTYLKTPTHSVLPSVVWKFGSWGWNGWITVSRYLT